MHECDDSKGVGALLHNLKRALLLDIRRFDDCEEDSKIRRLLASPVAQLCSHGPAKWWESGQREMYGEERTYRKARGKSGMKRFIKPRKSRSELGSSSLSIFQVQVQVQDGSALLLLLLAARLLNCSSRFGIVWLVTMQIR